MIPSFLTVFAAVYGASLAVYFAVGAALSRLNARRPDRRIQPRRDGSRRIRADIRASVKALAVTSLLLSAGFFARLQGWTVAPLAPSWWSLALSFAAILVLFDAWFYFGHRLLHHPAVFRFHALHHRAVAPTAWSTDCASVVDTLIEHGFYLVVWIVLPAPAAAIFALRLLDQVTGMIGHAGHEHVAGRSARAPFPTICTTYHDLHHSQFRYNFGNFFSIWDRLLGTMHPDYDRMVARMEDGEAPGRAAA
ncbi:MAG: fatty acid hydroxylase family protein, partial [Deinococcus-Thermus bacterium]|nr:fatty acid hydroxylase family protein [Deinococcota bacterium]